MGSKTLYAILGLLSGFFVSMFLNVLFIPWPSRAILLALLLAAVSVALLRRGPTALQRWRFAGGLFPLGYAFFALLLAILDTLIPPTAS